MRTVTIDCRFCQAVSKRALSIGCLLAICFWFCASVSAQYRFDSWTTDNGLPQGSINSILQTRDGYIWLATFGGLVRFDGLRFQVSTPATLKDSGAAASCGYTKIAAVTCGSIPKVRD